MKIITISMPFTAKKPVFGIYTWKKACDIGPLNLIGPFTYGKLCMIEYISSLIEDYVMEAYKNTIFGG